MRKRENNEGQKKKMNKWAGVSCELSGGWATACGCSLYGPTQSTSLWLITYFKSDWKINFVSIINQSIKMIYCLFHICEPCVYRYKIYILSLSLSPSLNNQAARLDLVLASASFLGPSFPPLASPPCKHWWNKILATVRIKPPTSHYIHEELVHRATVSCFPWGSYVIYCIFSFFKFCVLAKHILEWSQVFNLKARLIHIFCQNKYFWQN